MNDQISIEVFNRLVELAAMELSDEQAGYLHLQLNNQLRAIRELAEIPINNSLEANLHGVPYIPEARPELREDAWKPFADTESVLSQVPQFEEGHIVVPDIPHTTLK
jgi:aspartyl-tRNA(Asn)/glutamyl-tRNA(Gln) amidotransferase subunit C